MLNLNLRTPPSAGKVVAFTGCLFVFLLPAIYLFGGLVAMLFAGIVFHEFALLGALGYWQAVALFAVTGSLRSLLTPGKTGKAISEAIERYKAGK